MNIQSSVRSITDAINEYHRALAGFTEEEFCRRPANGKWSCSEVYCHILQVNMRSLLAVERCIYGKHPPLRSGVPLLSRLILYFGKFPPVKIKTPPNLEAIVTVVTREEARNDLLKFSRKLAEVLPKALKSSPYQRVKHPRLGMLNAQEWLRFVEIHTRHHLRQLEKIRKS